MEKLKIGFLILLFSLVAILTYSLTRSWFFFDKGIDLTEEEPIIEEKKAPTPISNDAIFENAEVIWEKFLYYPTDLSTEQGGNGPTGILHHARNLTFVNLHNGIVSKVFAKKVYIWDYFPGEFAKKKSILDDNKENETLDLGQIMIILAMTRDTNKDGFLNYKDKMKIFLYDPEEESLATVLPDEYYYEKMFFNTSKNILAMIVNKLPTKKEPSPSSKVYTYNISTKTGILVDLSENNSNKKKKA
ncbi:MAG: hypothetical protein KDK36_13045, partial [Leptospiraceae bacterium]|nr:hypothetical protein [Leptospiraceae bacterium]